MLSAGPGIRQGRTGSGKYRALRRAGIGASGSGAAMEALGFFVCTIDLKDELIRAFGTDEVERIIAAQGELRSLRTLQRQPPSGASRHLTSSAVS